MIRLHLSRALLAAGITLAMCAALPFLWLVVMYLWAGSGLPSLSLIGRILSDQHVVIFMFALLLSLLSVPMAILWCSGYPGAKLHIPWVASVCGGCLGILLSPAWYVLMLLMLPGNSNLSVDDYLTKLIYLGPWSVITGALFFFLHSFLIRQALGKKAWLETRV